jgi:transcriptional regulator with XRE-family HTH domain
MEKKDLKPKKTKDPIKNSLTFKNNKEEIRLLSEIVNYDFVDNIKRSLELRKISQTTLAKDIGVTASYVSQIFNCTRQLNISFITRIRKQYAIPLELIDTSTYFNNVTFIVFHQSTTYGNPDVNSDSIEIKPAQTNFLKLDALNK